VVEENGYLQDSLEIVAHFPLFADPEFFPRFMSFEPAAGVKLFYGLHKFFRLNIITESHRGAPLHISVPTQFHLNPKHDFQ
jgi:hypothetical protein